MEICSSLIASICTASSCPDGSFEVLQARIDPNVTVLLSDGHVAIANRDLVSAYIYSRARFFDNRCKEAAAEMALVILLYNCEHTTALNARRQWALQNSANLQFEMDLSKLLLSSPLYRHTKSSALWHYRRWLFKVANHRPGLSSEFSIVFAAAEQHPKNYYAWSHARIIISNIISDGNSTMWEELVGKNEKYAASHVSDVSAWTFLSWLICHLVHVNIWAWRDAFHHIGSIVESTIRVASTHESFWVFVQAVSACKNCDTGQILSLIECLKNKTDKEVSLHKRYIQWMELKFPQKFNI